MRTGADIAFYVRYSSNTPWNERSKEAKLADCAKSMQILPVCIHAASVVLDKDSSNTSPPTARQIRRAMTMSLINAEQT